MNINEVKPEKKPAMEFRTGERWFAAAIMVCGFLYWKLIHFVSLGAGVTIFGLVLCAVTLGYFKYSGIRQSARSLMWLGLTLISMIQFCLFSSPSIKFFNFIFLTASFIHWVCLSTKRGVDEKLSIYLVGDLWNQMISIPLSNFGSCIAGLIQKNGDMGKRRGAQGVFVGILISLPLIFIVVRLLIAADATFAGWVEHLAMALFSKNIFDEAWNILFGIPVALYIGGLIFGNVKGRAVDRIQKDSMDRFAVSLRRAPAPAIYSPVLILCIIYLVFFAAQATYLFSAFSGELPQTMTYAEYARRGFFELCAVSGINLAVIVIAHLFTERRDAVSKGLKLETIALCIFTLLLIATAISKMFMYIQCFGLTQLRVYTSWFMALLFFIFVVAIIRQLKKFNASRVIVIGFILLFMGLCYSNADGLITKYNIDRYEAGTLKFMDEQSLYKLSDAAIPHLYEVYQTTEDEEIKTRIRQVVTGEYEWGVATLPYEKTFRDFNVQSYRAEQIRENMKKEAK